MRTHWGTATDIGDRRDHNEDALLAAPPVFAVADGMGGHARGDMASAVVIAALATLAERAADGSRVHAEDVVAALAGAAAEIQRRMGEDHGGTQDTVAGTTVAGAVLTDDDGEPAWLVLNVGDSRVYRFFEGRLEQVSVDHSLVQQLVDAGTLTPEEAADHPKRHVITRAVGTGGLPEVDFWLVPATPGTRLLLCTDGLTGELSHVEIAAILTAERDAESAAHTLVNAAVRGQAQDNVTVVVVDVLPDDPA